ncbi:hypothetical protein [Streptomyces olivaceoviridis]|uniref:hypothetical protein n=1 Tax=Streptomyces olivaceoviridis TaxID=1921 RepID=UPI003679F8C4
MRIANNAGRLALVTRTGAVDVAAVSAGRFDADPQKIYARWEEFQDWAWKEKLPGGQPFTPADCER